MLVVVGAGKASPGATTAAIALALSWPREVLLVDADPFGGDVVPGLLPGRLTADLGLLTWATATRRETVLASVEAITEHVVALPEAPGVWLMPGLQSASQMGAVTPAWARLAQSLERASSVLGRDVIVDAGRLGDASCWPVVESADVLLLVARSTMRSVCATASAVDLVTRKVGDTDGTRLVLTAAGSYTSAQIGEVIDLELVGSLSADPKAAAALTDGAVVGVGGMRRSRLLRSASLLARDLVDHHHSGVDTHAGGAESASAAVTQAGRS